MKLKKLKRKLIFAVCTVFAIGGIVCSTANVNAAVTGIGTAITDSDNGMFNNRDDNTWLFGGGIETQGRFSETRGARNFVGQFEEYVRYRGNGKTINEMQRYVINVGKTGNTAVEFDEKLERFIEDLDPKAVVYLIGPEDYNGGTERLEDFKTALQSMITKSLSARSGKGFFVIQMPHAVKDGTKAADITLYAEAAERVIEEYCLEHAEKKSHIVCVDHLAQTNNEGFLNECLTEEGLLNAKGHYEVAKELVLGTMGTVSNFQTTTYWTEETMPQYYETAMPEVKAEAKGQLKVSIPADIALQISSWQYTLEIEDIKISGLAEEKENRTFVIKELPEEKDYSLLLQSSDGALQMPKVYGNTSVGNIGGAMELSPLQKKIKEKTDSKEPLTWLFMGDSITHACLHTYGYDGIAQIFEKYLKEDLGRSDDIVINTGVSSAQTRTTLDNIEQRLTKYHADIVAVMLGTNDRFDGDTIVTVEKYEENLKEIVRRARESNPNVQIIFRTPSPTTQRGSVLESGYLQTMKRVAIEDGNILLIDQYTDWTKEFAVFPYLCNIRYYYGNALHPGAAGQLRMAQQFIRESGQNTDTRIANLAFHFDYMEEASSIQPQIAVGNQMIELDLAALQSAYGEEKIGSVEVKLTNKVSGKSSTKSAYMSEKRFLMRNLPNEGDPVYEVQVIGTLSGSAKHVTFQQAEAILKEDQEPLPFHIVLNCNNIRNCQTDSVVGRISTDGAAPDGDYQYRFCGMEYDNDKFEIEGDILKVKSDLEKNQEYRVCIQAVKTDDNQICSSEEIFELRTLPTLEDVRKEAQISLEESRAALDLDLSGMAFQNGAYVDLGNENSVWYADGAYLDVLNCLRTKSTGGAILFRFRTTQENGLIFACGSSSQDDKNTMSFSLVSGMLRVILRNENGTSLRGNISNAGGRMLYDGEWHTVAMSFDTTGEGKTRISIDGSDNLYSQDAGWQHKSWFSVNPEDEITYFAIGGGMCASLLNINEFTGDLDFVTVTDTVYTEEELAALSETPYITGSQNITIANDAAVVPKDASYTVSNLEWNESGTEAEFTLTAKEGFFFDRSGFGLFVEHAEVLKSEISDKTVLVKISIQRDVSSGKDPAEEEEPDVPLPELEAPVISEVKAVAEKKKLGIKITVQKVENADIYTVYCVNGSQTTEVGKTDAAGIVYDENPISKKKVSYYAVAFDSSGKYQKSKNGQSKSIQLAASTKKITAKQTAKKSQARISWKKVKGATKYYIYRSEKKNSGYVRLKAVGKKKLYYIDKKVIKGKTYYYRIAAQKKKTLTGIITSKALKIKK